MSEIAVEDYMGIGGALAAAEAKGYKAGLCKAVEMAEERARELRQAEMFHRWHDEVIGEVTALSACLRALAEKE